MKSILAPEEEGNPAKIGKVKGLLQHRVAQEIRAVQPPLQKLLLSCAPTTTALYPAERELQGYSDNRASMRMVYVRTAEIR